MIALLPAAGLGSRLFPATLNQPKEMLPVPVFSNGQIFMKPTLQIIFEQLYKLGIREFFIVIGTSKEAVIRHFTPNERYLPIAREMREEIDKFYNMLRDSQICYLIQSHPRGFGDAVLQARNLVKEDFLVIAGDTIITSYNPRVQEPQDPLAHFRRLLEIHNQYTSLATLSLQTVEDPRRYGVVEGEREEKEGNVIRIQSAVEKPQEPPTNLAITGLYIFKPDIFDALEELRAPEGGELQLTDGINTLARRGVYGVLMDENDRRYDIGSPELYGDVFTQLYELARRGARIV